MVAPAISQDEDSGYHVSLRSKGHKAWIDVKSQRFLIWMAIQDVVVIASGMKPVITSTYHECTKLPISAINL
jgi:hypothetical protein